MSAPDIFNTGSRRATVSVVLLFVEVDDEVRLSKSMVGQRDFPSQSGLQSFRKGTVTRCHG